MAENLNRSKGTWTPQEADLIEATSMYAHQDKRVEELEATLLAFMLRQRAINDALADALGDLPHRTDRPYWIWNRLVEAIRSSLNDPLPK
jgi:hypothetical protein